MHVHNTWFWCLYVVCIHSSIFVVPSSPNFLPNSFFSPTNVSPHFFLQLLAFSFHTTRTPPLPSRSQIKWSSSTGWAIMASSSHFVTRSAWNQLWQEDVDQGQDKVLTSAEVQSLPRSTKPFRAHIIRRCKNWYSHDYFFEHHVVGQEFHADGHYFLRASKRDCY